MIDNTLTRRRILQGIGVGVSGPLISNEAIAKKPADGSAERHIIGTKSKRGKRAARGRAKEVVNELDFGDIGQAVVGRFPPEALDALRNHAGVRYVEPDGQVEAIGESLPWGVDRIDADVAHSNGETGQGADIAIIDSGIDSDHPDLQANLGTGYAVETCSGCDEPWDDDNSHGTHCAGIAGAVDNTEGVVGGSTEATLHAVKVIGDDGYASVSGLADGIQWTADQGYDVGSMSLGASDSYSTLQDACQYAYDKGVLLVAAAGNDGCSGCVRYPAAYSTVVAVSATNSDDSIASYSSTGDEVELAAPGTYIYSTVPGGYSTKSGTSMACPHVSGVGGLVMAHGHSNTKARQILQDTAEDIGLSSDAQGYGLVDAEAAANAASDGGGGGDTNVAVSTDGASSVGETSVTFNGSLTDLGGASSADCYFEYRETGTSTWSTTSTQTLSSTGTFSQSVSGLEDGVDYEYRAVADASDGDTDTGSSVTFTTTDDPPAVTTDSPTNVADSSATLNGSLTDLGNASSADCYFEYRESGTSSWSTTSVQTLSSTGSFSQDISGLSTGTDYEFRAITDASDGDTDTGSSVSFTTSTSDTSVAVATDQESSVGTSSVTLNGDLTDLGGASSADCAFKYRESGTSTWTETSAQTLSSTGSYSESISGLSSGTDYEFCAVADASDGDTDTGSTITFTTDSSSGGNAPAIDSYSVTEAGSPNPHAEITAKWSVSDADGDLDSVLVEVFDSSGSLVDSARTSVSGGSASGTDKFKFKHVGKATYDLTLTVTDASGYSATQTKQVSS
ncbi:serine protease [Haloferax mediterranei ATCC 33500]|uniref:Serine protease n=1 Tax=Haloferax mediterranei (strain ATCC 33500 / DSM 1411 / JCM 8866 / NBRC 14739 / NCIMB 2177 / R-4) TaxID=523841 RepID=A0A059TV56_HALMT|nr:serine protease [Haloferax mediterranei ATCC 33500]